MISRSSSTKKARGARKTAKRPPRAASSRGSWVRRVSETSNAMDLEPGVFTRSPKEIAESLERSVMGSRRTKGTKYQSAMSMLNLYINRSGRKLGPRDRARLERAKDELRRVLGREGARRGGKK